MVPLNDVKANSKLLIIIYFNTLNFYFSLSLNIRWLCLVFPCIHFLFSNLAWMYFFLWETWKSGNIRICYCYVNGTPHTTLIDGDLFEWMFSDSWNLFWADHHITCGIDMGSKTLFIYPLFWLNACTWSSNCVVLEDCNVLKCSLFWCKPKPLAP